MNIFGDGPGSPCPECRASIQAWYQRTGLLRFPGPCAACVALDSALEQLDPILREEVDEVRLSFNTLRADAQRIRILQEVAAAARRHIHGFLEEHVEIQHELASFQRRVDAERRLDLLEAEGWLGARVAVPSASHELEPTQQISSAHAGESGPSSSSQAAVAPSAFGSVAVADDSDSVSEGSEGSEQEAYRTMEEYDRYLESQLD